MKRVQANHDHALHVAPAQQAGTSKLQLASLHHNATKP
jgi:hypothetical protein